MGQSSGGGDAGAGDAGAGDAGAGDAGAGAGSTGTSELFAGAGAGDAGGDPGAGILNTPEWAASLENVDTKNFIAKKGWESADALVESYRQLESTVGVPEGQILRMKPVEDRDAWHGADGIYAKLGRPDSPEGYDFTQIEIGEGVDITEAYRKFAFEHGSSKSDAEASVQWFAETVQAAERAQQLGQQAAQTKQLEATKIEWGSDWDVNVATARQGMAALGIDQEIAAAVESQIGTGEFLKRMLTVGRAVGEHSAGDYGSGQSGSYLSVEAAKAEIDTLRSNTDFMDTWVNGHADGNAEARDKMDALMAIAYPG
jgi:hypothetical protein